MITVLRNAHIIYSVTHTMNTYSGIYSDSLLTAKVARSDLLILPSLEIESNLSFVLTRFPLWYRIDNAPLLYRI